MARNRSNATTTGWDWVRAAGVQIVVIMLAVIFHRPMFGGNFAAVEPGRVYRSAQLQESLEATLNRNHIASVLNLRGGSERDPWYRNEVEKAAKSGADFYDFPLRPDRRPTKGQLLALVDLFERCRYPILIHCKSGADRTGMASGLYLLTRRGTPPEDAVRAFTITHSHIALGGPEHLHEPFFEYASWLKDQHLTHSADRFRRWLHENYHGPDGDEPFHPVQPGARLAHRAGVVKKVAH